MYHKNGLIAGWGEALLRELIMNICSECYCSKFSSQ